MFNSYQGGRVPRHFPGPTQFNNHIAKDIQHLETEALEEEKK